MNLLEQLAKAYYPDGWADSSGCTCGQCAIMRARYQVMAKKWVREALVQGDRDGWVALLDEVRGVGK